MTARIAVPLSGCRSEAEFNVHSREDIPQVRVIRIFISFVFSVSHAAYTLEKLSRRAVYLWCKPKTWTGFTEGRPLHF